MFLQADLVQELGNYEINHSELQQMEKKVRDIRDNVKVGCLEDCRYEVDLLGKN